MLCRNECMSSSTGSPAASRAVSKASFALRFESRPHRSVTHIAGCLPTSKRGLTSVT
jgi:hypothetical protein